MSLQLNRVSFRAASNGTGDFVVSTVIAGFRTPATAGLPDGSIVDYTAESDDKTEWETGVGTYTAGTVTLARTTVRESSNGNAAVNFTAAPKVFIDLHAQSLREKLTANRTIFVRALLGSVALSIASPAVASLVGHGLQADDPVVFSIPEDRVACTFT